MKNNIIIFGGVATLAVMLFVATQTEACVPVGGNTYDCSNLNTQITSNEKSVVITRLATNKKTTSVLLNAAHVKGNEYDRNCQAFFEFGPSYESLTRTEPQNLINYNTVNNFSKFVTGLAPNTTYFYRAVSICPSGARYGGMVAFRTLNPYQAPTKVTVRTSYTQPTKKVVSAKSVNSVSKSGSQSAVTQESKEFMLLTIDRVSYESGSNGMINFRVYFKNISNQELSNIVVRVELPKELSVQASDFGQFNKGGRNVLLNIPVIEKGQEGMFVVNAVPVKGVKEGTQFTANVFANFTVPSVITSGIPFKGEVKNFVNGLVDVPAASANSEANVKSWLPENLIEVMIGALVFLIFIAALRYVMTAFKSTN
jgi:hypothetical protein